MNDEIGVTPDRRRKVAVGIFIQGIMPFFFGAIGRLLH